MKSPEFRSKRLVWRFQKSGGDGRLTVPFQRLPVSAQSALQRDAVLADDEIASIACYRGPDDWVLLTTSRLVWKEAGNMISVAGDEIEDVTIATPVDSTVDSISDLSRLRVVTNEASFDLLLEAGAPFFGFWNAIRMLHVSYRAPQEKPLDD